MKTFEIEIPKGYEIDRENSTFEKIVFKKVKKEFTYSSLSVDLFYEKKCYYTDAKGRVMANNTGFNQETINPNNSTTKEQLESILALNKLCNVAKYFNGDWLPELMHSYRYSIRINTKNELFVEDTNQTILSEVYFKTEELALLAIKILGEEEIRKALTLNN